MMFEVGDIDKIQNHFIRTVGVKSLLRIGNFDFIRNPWLTIAIPTYKRDALLLDALDSIKQQKKVYYLWDIVIVDNEPWDGKANDTEKMIQQLNNPRITYYRNEEALAPIDNWNRCIQLSRGKWIGFLHDDDLLVANYLELSGKYIKAFSHISSKPIGYISASYYPFYGDSRRKDPLVARTLLDTEDWINKRNKGRLKRVSQLELLVMGYPGVHLPSNGTLMNRDAVLDFGGFNNDAGIGRDVVLPYLMMNKYSVYTTISPLGFYRWFNNISMSKKVSIETAQYFKHFREYMCSKSILGRIWCIAFGRIVYTKNISENVDVYNAFSGTTINPQDICLPSETLCSKRTVWMYSHTVGLAYRAWKKVQSLFLGSAFSYDKFCRYESLKIAHNTSQSKKTIK